MAAIPNEAQAEKQEMSTLTRIKQIRDKVGKLRYDLIPPMPLAELAYVYSAGAKKYEENGWLEHPMPYSELFGRIGRHQHKIQMGEMFDMDDGQMHAASIAWAGFALCQYQLSKAGLDTRRIYVPAPYWREQAV